MRSKEGSSETDARYLGIECGGTRTVAILADGRGRLLGRVETGPANLRLITDRELARCLTEFRATFPGVAAVGIGMAGVRGDADRARVTAVVDRVWPGLPCWAHHDLESALAAAGWPGKHRAWSQTIVLSGTGSCCYGRAEDGRVAKVGGWGHILGDKGSGYEIGLRALKAVVYYLDRDGEWSGLGAALLAATGLNDPEALIGWVQKAGKPDIARLAVVVFDSWRSGDRIAADILTGAASSLAKDAVACASRLGDKSQSARFVFAGSVLLKQPRFAAWVRKRIQVEWPGATVGFLRREGAWGGVEMARHAAAAVLGSGRGALLAKGATAGIHEMAAKTTASARSVVLAGGGGWRPESRELPPTERRNPRSRRLDRMSTLKAVRLMLDEEAGVAEALRAAAREISRAVGDIAASFARGGRLIYVGAGTSGRLGILDASECPPTFQTAPEQVQAVIAGGSAAVTAAVEGAEDDWGAGAEALRFRDVRSRDTVVGIAASGRTAFVWGALAAASAVGAATVLVCCNPHLEIPRSRRPQRVIVIDTGPEVLTGSTRLKAGTATKIVLNTLSTLAMVKAGKVVENLMVDLNPSNVKLKERAVRIVRELAGGDDSAARSALEASGWSILRAVGREAPREPRRGRIRR